MRRLDLRAEPDAPLDAVVDHVAAGGLVAARRVAETLAHQADKTAVPAGPAPGTPARPRPARPVLVG